MLNTDRFEEFISQYPIYEYRLVDTAEIEVRERVRIICKQECERYGTTWLVPLLWAAWKNVGSESTVIQMEFFFPVWQRFLM